MALIAVLSITTSVAWTVASGQDLNFDLITYHYYLGYSAFVARFHLDFLPAWVYGYQSPLPFVLLYWLDSTGTPPVLVAALHATTHALSLIILYLLAAVLLGKIASPADRAKVIAFWLLGAIAPVYWTLVGTSFADVLTSAPILFSVLLVAVGIPAERLRPANVAWMVISGAFMGAAVGARIHNSIYAIALLCALMLVRLSDRQSRLGLIAAFSLAAFVAWFACFAPWGYRLYREFGSPLFPLFNGFLRSPDFPASNISLISFASTTFGDLMALPFRIATDSPWVYVELPLPDIRPAVLVLALVACGLLGIYRRAARRDIAAESHRAIPYVDDGLVQRRRVILIFFAASAALWLITSSNGRFGVALFLLGGPVCGFLLSRVLPSRYVFLIIAAVVLWQAALQGVFFPEHRFNSMPWTDRYFDWNLPEHLTHKPATFASFGFQPASTLVPHLHRQSSNVNISEYPAIDMAGSDRVRRTIGIANRPTYGVFDVTRQNPVNPAAIKKYYRNQLALWGLAFTDQQCDLVTLKASSEPWMRLNRFLRIKERYRPPIFLVCPLQANTTANHEHALSEYRSFVKRLAPLIAHCPRFFGRPLGYVHTDKGWFVTSFASAEMRLYFDDDSRFYLQKTTPPHVALEVGRLRDEQLIADEPDCQEWFFKLRELSKRAAGANG
jgi:hypothetical protein